MTVRISEVGDRAGLERWVRFPLDLYRGHPYRVPPLIADELAYFDRRRNPAYEVAEACLLLATAGDRTVGRVCGIVNALETRKLGHPRGRFGWFEATEDPQVARALLDAICDWLRRRGCTEVTGPQGFGDLDPEGLLIEGFDRLPTVSGSYNLPYYRELLEGYSLRKAVDYVEYRCNVPAESALIERLRRRYGGTDRYRVVTCRSRRELLARAPSIWRLIEEAFAPLYGVVPLTPRQTEFYTRKYFAFLDPDFVKLPYSSDGELVGFFIAMPNLSRGFQRAGGRFLPFGLLPILRDYRWPETVDFLLAGVKPGEPSGLVTAITLVDMLDTLRRRGVRFMETNRELEDNATVNRIWLNFERDYFRRSRVYVMDL
jgi:hypothetical protein